MKTPSDTLTQLLIEYLDSVSITGDSIGEIRRRLMMPFDCEWNAFVRDVTAERERAKSQGVAINGQTGPRDLVQHRADVEAALLDRIKGTPNEDSAGNIEAVQAYAAFIEAIARAKYMDSKVCEPKGMTATAINREAR